MRISDFTEEMRDDIIRYAKRSLLKLGINIVDVKLEVRKHSYTVDEYLRIETSEFNTTPVIYESIKIDGTGTLIPIKDHTDVYDLCISLGYRFKYFGGGKNGVDIGTLKFRVFDASKRIAFVGFIM